METYKEIEGFDGVYAVSNYGNVLNKKTGRVLKPKDNVGYARIGLNKNGIKYSFLVHRLVLIAFNYIENHKNFMVNHKNRNPMDNRVENLEWCTNTQNQIHWRADELFNKSKLLKAVKKAIPL